MPADRVVGSDFLGCEAGLSGDEDEGWMARMGGTVCIKVEEGEGERKEQRQRMAEFGGVG